jgi:hypothetical protein
MVTEMQEVLAAEETKVEVGLWRQEAVRNDLELEFLAAAS